MNVMLHNMLFTHFLVSVFLHSGLLAEDTVQKWSPWYWSECRVRRW